MTKRGPRTKGKAWGKHWSGKSRFKQPTGMKVYPVKIIRYDDSVDDGTSYGGTRNTSGYAI